MDAEDLLCKVLTAVNDVPVGEGLQIYSYIHSNNLAERDPILIIALRLMVTVPVTSNWREKCLIREAFKAHPKATILQEHLSALSQICIEHKVTRSLHKTN